MDRVWRIRGWIFFKFLPYQPRIDKKYQMLKKVEGLMIFRTYLKLWERISVMKNDIHQPIEKWFDRTPPILNKLNPTNHEIL